MSDTHQFPDFEKRISTLEGDFKRLEERLDHTLADVDRIRRGVDDVHERQSTVLDRLAAILNNLDAKPSALQIWSMIGSVFVIAIMLGTLIVAGLPLFKP